MHTHRTEVPAWPADLIPERGTLVLSGYGIDVRVWRGRLRVEDGIGTERRVGLLHRALSGLRRVVIIGHTGSISLDAVRWLDGIGASLVQLDADGEVLCAFRAGGYEQPRLRRAQARALGQAEGLELARWLIERKVQGQLGLVDGLGRWTTVAPEVRPTLTRVLGELPTAGSADHVRYLESVAAVAYWSAWSALPVRFARQDVVKVPEHWRTFGNRASAITRQPRLATTPANAMLNYLYAILESEAVIAARTMGLDPGLGVFHVDSAHRDSLAADLMEPVRPDVDAYLLELLTTRSFGARDFFETQQGVCRITPGLATELIATSDHWARLVGAVAEELARRLGEPVGLSVPQLITNPHGKPAKGVPRPRIDRGAAPEVVRRRCAVCGGPVQGRDDRTCSADCLQVARVQQATAGGKRSQETLRRLRAEGCDPGKTPEALTRMAASQARRRAEQREWDLAHPDRPDDEVYWREVYPRVRGMQSSHIIEATGLSQGQAWRIKHGKAVPHRRWWGTLTASHPGDSRRETRICPRENTTA